MAKNINTLYHDLRMAIEGVGYKEALLIVDTTLEEMDPVIPRDTERLADSGFGYINGKMVAETDKGRSTSNYGVVPPVDVPVTNPGEGQYDITISYHTPKPAGDHATVTKMEGGQEVFDYAPYVLEGYKGLESMIRTEPFRSRRASALKGMLGKRGSVFDASRIRLAVERGLQRGLTLTAQRIVQKLSEL